MYYIDFYDKNIILSLEEDLDTIKLEVLSTSFT